MEMFPTSRIKCRIQQFVLMALMLWSLYSSALMVSGHPTYVPQTEEVCNTMEPHHKRDPQRTDSPFKVIVYGDKIQPGKSIWISLVSTEDRESMQRHLKKHHKNGFKGFYVQARDTRQNQPIGKFTPKEDKSVKVHNCGLGTENAAFHGVKGHKTNVTIEWTAPKDFQGKVIFTTTFVKKYHKFWTNVKSSPVSIRIPFRKILA